MKVVMYHYVREYNTSLPHFRFLDVSNFEQQLDFFDKEYGFISRHEWDFILLNKSLGSAKGKVLLTFDDAMSCHYDYVYKVLSRRGLWGIFYVPTFPYQNNSILPVHKIHLLCGAFDGNILLHVLKGLINDDMIPDSKILEFKQDTYLNQNNLSGVSDFKRILNYFISYNIRDDLIDNVASTLNFSFNKSEFYVSIGQLKEMVEAGNIIGSHSVTHPVMSKLSYSQQLYEIKSSLDFLRLNIDKSINTYCHPYGGFHSFDNNTLNILQSNSIDYSFNVESRDVCDNDFNSSIYHLPRYDCNLFPFGNAS